MKYFKILKLIGIIGFIYIISKLNFKIIFHSLKEMNIFYMILYSFAWYFFLLGKVYRWHTIECFFATPLKFRENLWVFLETIYLSFITPSQLGDVARVWVINNFFSVDKKKAFLAYVFDKVQDLYFLSIFCLIGVCLIIDFKIPVYIYFLLIIIICLYIFKNKILSIFKTKFRIIPNLKSDTKLEMKVFFINIIIYFFYFIQLYLLAKALHIDLKFTYIISLLSISSILSLLPISISGLGVREGVFIYLLKSIGISKEIAVLLSLLDSIVFVAFFIIILTIFSKFFLEKQINFKVRE